MKGKNNFTKIESKIIKDLLELKNKSSRDKQKIIRDKIRKIGFYITDFDETYQGFTKKQFESLIKIGKIKII